MKKIRILFIIDSLEFGGTEQQLKYLFSGIDKERFEIYLCYFTDREEMLDTLAQNCMEVFKVKKKWKIDLSLIKRIMAIIREKEISIVQTLLFTADLWGRIAVFGERFFSKRLFKVVSSKRNQNKLGMVRVTLMKILDSKSDAIVANCETVKDFIFKSEGIPKDKIEVIYNGIDTTGLSQVEPADLVREYGIRKDTTIIGTVGRLVPVKNHYRFINMAEKLLSQFQDLFFFLVGGGPEEGNLKRLAQEKKLDNKLVITGATSKAQAFIKSFDIYVSTSITEGFSNSILEAMALGKTVWATPVGAATEIIKDGVNGFFIKHGNTTVQELCSLYEIHKRQREKIADSAKLAASRFSIETMVKRHEVLYERLFH